MKKKIKVLFLSTDSSNNDYRKKHNKAGGISQYRLLNPMKALTNIECDYVGSDFNDGSDGIEMALWYKKRFEGYDMVISKIIDNPVAASGVRFMTEHLGIPLVVDIDDNIWEVKEDNPAYEEYQKGAPKLGFASSYVSLADAVFTSTQPLADYIKERFHNTKYGSDKIFVLPNCLDITQFDFPKAETDSDKIVIGWQGSITHQEDLKMVMPAIMKLMKEYPNMYLELVGGITEKQLPILFKGMTENMINRISCKGGTLAYDTFPELLSKQKWDIAIAPITDDLFNQSKSHIKWMEYAMMQIPCVASNVYPYREPIQGTEVIVNESTGILAKKNEWYDKLKDLIENKRKREIIGQNAYNFVTSNWDIYKHSFKWEEAIDKVLATS